MTASRVALPVGLAALLLMVHCGKNAVSSQEEEMHYRGAQVIASEDLPSCDSANGADGWLYYVLDDANFQYCNGEEYVTLDFQAGSEDAALNWLGNKESDPDNPSVNDAYYNTPNNTVYIWDGSKWSTLVSDGVDGKSIVWKGISTSAPSDPDTNWAYFNSTDKVSYVFNGTGWDTLAVGGSDGSNGEDGRDGVDGKSIIWKGISTSAPSDPDTNWAYYNSTDKVSYVYNGTGWDTLAVGGSDGSDGTDGQNTLLRISDELPGDNCAAGGQMVETGLDSNGNGILEDNEVSDTSYICRQEKVWDGDYEITDVMSGILIMGYTGITGNLVVNVTNPENLNFLNWLTSVGGNLEIQNNGSLANLNGLNALTTVGGDLSIGNNTALRNLNGLNTLSSVGGLFAIYRNDILTNFDGLSALTSVGSSNPYGGLSIYENAELADMTGLNALTTVNGDFSVTDNPMLPECQADNLADRLGLTTSTITGNDETATCQ